MGRPFAEQSEARYVATFGQWFPSARGGRPGDGLASPLREVAPHS